MRRPITLILLLILAISAFPIVPSIRSASWWDADWQYCKSITITGATGAGTNYQMPFHVYNGSGSDSGEDVYLDGKSLAADYADVRFLAEDNVTVLDCWQFNTSATASYFWVEIADTLEGSGNSTTIYLYYGNSAATPVSDGADTFIIFDDFNDNSIDTGKWIIGNDTGKAVNETGGQMTFYRDTSADNGLITTAAGPFIKSVVNITRGVAISADIYAPTGKTYLQHGIGIVESANDAMWFFEGRWASFWNDAARYWEEEGGSESEIQLDATDYIAYSNSFEIKFYYTNGTNAMYINGTLKGFGTNANLANTTECKAYAFLRTHTTTATATVDNFIVRAWVPNGPTYGDWSAEEEAPAADTTPPTFGTGSSNATVVSTPCSLSIAVYDETGVSYITVQHNNTGTLANETWIAIPANGTTMSFTITLNDTVGVLIVFKFYANDTAGNVGASGEYNLTTAEAPAGGPTIVSLSATPSLVFRGEGFSVACTVSLVADTELQNVTITLSNWIVLLYDDATNSFSIINATGWLVVSNGSSSITDTNATVRDLIFSITSFSDHPTGEVDGTALAYDDTGESGSLAAEPLYEITTTPIYEESKAPFATFALVFGMAATFTVLGFLMWGRGSLASIIFPAVATLSWVLIAYQTFTVVPTRISTMGIDYLLAPIAVAMAIATALVALYAVFRIVQEAAGIQTDDQEYYYQEENE